VKRVGSYGSGFLSRIKRATGDVIAFRWHDEGRERKRVLGLASVLKTEAMAWNEVQRLGLGKKGCPETLKQLTDHWQEKEKGKRAFSTVATIDGYIKNWITPAWGSQLLNEIKAVAVESWLGGLSLAPGSKKKIRDIMHLLYEHAIRYEFTERNPISKVRQSGRHSYTTLLRQNGNNPKVVQDLLRHASYQITANIYDSAVSDEKRKAHSGVIRLVTRTRTRTGRKKAVAATA